MGRRPELDGLRGLAILLVLAEHVGVLPAGWMGVSLFFVLSGFLITSLLVSEHERTGTVSLGGFYVRRVARLYPALLVGIGAFWVLARLTWPSGDHDLIAGDVIVALFYVGNFVRGLRPGPADPVAFSWSLALEEQFYLLWPPLLRRLLGRGVSLHRIAAGAVTLAVGIACLRTAVAGNVAAGYFVTRGDEILLGCALGLVAVKIPRGVLWLAGAGFVALLTLDVSGEVRTRYLVTAATVCCAGMLLLAMREPAVRAVFSVAPLRYFGRISYALYLWNGVLSGVWWQQSRGDLLDGWRGWAAIAVEVALAALSTHLLEEPIRRRVHARRVSEPAASDKPLIPVAS